MAELDEEDRTILLDLGFDPDYVTADEADDRD